MIFGFMSMCKLAEQRIMLNVIWFFRIFYSNFKLAVGCTCFLKNWS